MFPVAVGLCSLRIISYSVEFYQAETFHRDFSLSHTANKPTVVGSG